MKYFSALVVFILISFSAFGQGVAVRANAGYGTNLTLLQTNNVDTLNATNLNAINGNLQVAKSISLFGGGSSLGTLYTNEPLVNREYFTNAFYVVSGTNGFPFMEIVQASGSQLWEVADAVGNVRYHSGEFDGTTTNFFPGPVNATTYYGDGSHLTGITSPTFNVNQFGNGSGADGTNIISGSKQTNNVFYGNAITSHALTNQFDTNIYVGPYSSWLNMDISRIYLGFGAGNYSITNGGLDTGQGFTNSEDVLIGRLAGSSLHGTNDEYFNFIGSFAGSATVSGAGSVAIGQKSMNVVTNNQSSVAIGTKSLGNSLTLNGDVAIGYAAAQFANRGASPSHGFGTFIGYNAGQYDDADNDAWVGANAGSSAGAIHGTGGNNAGIGFGVGQSLTSGSQNTLAGYQAGTSLTGGAGWTALGYQAAFNATGGDNNIAIGDQVGFGWTGGFGNVLLGSSAGQNLPNQNNTMIVGHDGVHTAVTNYFFGGDAVSTAASTWGFVLHATGGSGANVAAASATLAGGQGTGTGAGGAVNLAVAPAGTSGSTLNALTNTLIVTPGNITAPPGIVVNGNGAGLSNVVSLIAATVQSGTNGPYAQTNADNTVTLVDVNRFPPFQSKIFPALSLVGGASGSVTNGQWGFGVDNAAGGIGGSAYYLFGTNALTGTTVVDWRGRIVQDYGAGPDTAHRHYGPIYNVRDGNNFCAFVGFEANTNFLEIVDEGAGLTEVDTIISLPYKLIAGQEIGVRMYPGTSTTNIHIVIFDYNVTPPVVMTNISYNISQEWFTNANNTAGFAGTHTFGTEGVTSMLGQYDANTNMICGGPQLYFQLQGDPGTLDSVASGVLSMTNAEGNFKTFLSPVQMGDGVLKAEFNANANTRAFGFALHSSQDGYRTIVYYDFNTPGIRFARVDPAANLTILNTGSDPAPTVGTNYQFIVRVDHGTNYTWWLNGKTGSFSDTNTDWSLFPNNGGYCGPVIFAASAGAVVKISNWEIVPAATQIGGKTVSYAVHFEGITANPTIVTNAGAGGGTGTVTVDSGANDAAGTITLNTGTLPASASTMLTLTFATAYDSAPHVMFCPANNNAASLTSATSVFIDTVATGNFTMKSGATGLSGATTYKWNYQVIR